MLFRGFHSSLKSLKKKAKTKQISSISLASLLNRFTSSLNIAKKIGYGYSLSIGIAIMGTSSGLAIANHYENQAQRQLELADKQEYILRRLQNAVLIARLHPQRLFAVLEDAIWLEFEKSKFLTDVNQINTELTELEDFVENNAENLVVEKTDLQNLLNKYQINTEIYTEFIKSWWQKIDSYKLASQTIPSKQNDLVALVKGEKEIRININFEMLSEELTRILIQADTQRQQANVSFRRAQELRLQIIIGSMVVSVIFAVLLALYTSRVIASPLQAVTNVAKKITAESNFNLRANVRSKDEVGTLAISLNQLVEWVGDYTNELELARQTLEKRVEERTQQLTQTLQDLKETQGQLIHTEKMSSLGQMVAGVAHEINNPVNFINGNLECANNYFQDLLTLVDLYQEYYPNPEPIIEETIEEIDLEYLTQDLSKLLSSMKIGSKRIREIVLSLRNFSRLDEAEMKEVDIHEGIDNTLLILNHRLKKGFEVIKNYEDLPMLECYPAQLNQVFMNILSNAIDSLLDDKSDKPSKQIVISTSKSCDNYIKLSIRDNGSGIPVEIQHKLFDPFFTTKPVGKGTGLGLSICYGIIEKHNGKIEVFSELEQGTEFVISIPINGT
ncbi:ATP-binding protein [Mastigocoleus sp. MO_188.B34]|uniref:sensor histidine kinase n=1 Tax=Mastigocoleus sp. MO_188.B34 TaxID=3036635 RepID=UPI00261AEFDD|nr:ATP-binding protein [Mastigocoleus sp. MO_188.B34]MDJ0697274.1 ATP-binding protein [Mastigocoleus sp. MO_188.B34]